MRLIDLLNRLEQDGALAELYRLGAVTLAVYAQRELYNTYRALLTTPHYADQPGRAAQATATTCGVHLATVYRALNQMERPVKQE